MYRGEILDEADLPMRFCAVTACYRREAGAAGRDTRGLLRVHEFDKVELFAYATEAQAASVHADIVARAEALLQELGLQYRVLDLCTGDLSASSARTFDLEVYSPGSTSGSRSPRSAGAATTRPGGPTSATGPTAGGPPVLVHTLNGSALAWARIWAALVETGRQPDGSVGSRSAWPRSSAGRPEIRPR